MEPKPGMKKMWFIISLKGKDKPNDSILGCNAVETGGKLVIKDEVGDVVAVFSASEVQGWQTAPFNE
jgi:hypothetical protein